EPQHLIIGANGMMVTITEQEGFIGSEEVVFTVRDPSGLTDSDTMMVSVVPLKLPPVWQKIPKIGFAQGGMYSDLVLWNYVEDQDGEDRELTFAFSGYDDVDSIYVDPSDGRLFLYDLDDTPGWDWVTVSATDYDSNVSSTRFLVFIAPKDGTPIVGAIPDTTMRAGRPLEWIDLDDYYYDIDNMDSQMTWSWSRIDADSLVSPNIHALFHTVTLTTYSSQSTGIDNIRFTVTDPEDKSAGDDCLITVLGETKPVLDMPAKIGFVTGDSTVINLDSYVEDPDFEDDRLVWNWWGNENIEMGYDTTDTTYTRPFYLTSTEGWVGWERVFFRVQNPLDSAATDSTLVFSVPADGTPVAGGLLYLYLRAGECNTTEIDLDDYYYDADTPDWGVTWTATGNESVQVSIDPTTHRAQFCSPSETFEGQEIVTLTVSDGVHEASMDVTVVVLEAALRNVFALMVFRNPMQSDYMDFYLQSVTELSAAPEVDVQVTTDSSLVAMKAVGDSAVYYHGMYLLPYDSSLGVQRDAVVVARALTKSGKAVEDTLSFTYGRFGPAGGKLALETVTVDVPPGALKLPALLTIVPIRPDGAEGAAKPATDEIIFTGVPYSIGPERLAVEEPFTVEFALCCRTDGAGIYLLGSDGWEYLPGTLGAEMISIETVTLGTFRLGFDRTPPEVVLEAAGDGHMTFMVSDRGSGIDETSLLVTWNGRVLIPRVDPSSGAYTVELPDYLHEHIVRLAVDVSDRTGNTCQAVLEARVEPAPGQFSVSQNVPNPFNPRTLIPFNVSSELRVSVEVYDILGRRIAVLADGIFAPGTHQVVWWSRDSSGRPVSSGIYFYRVCAGDMVVTKKMVLMR
ncbi:T9SS type A sorting domain-containing protein, partial [Candidatus Latescibacterota bacterium]